VRIEKDTGEEVNPEEMYKAYMYCMWLQRDSLHAEPRTNPKAE